MVRRDDEAARLGRDRVGLDALVLQRRAQQGDVEVAVEEGLREPGALLHDEPHVRLAGHLGREDRPVQLGEAGPSIPTRSCSTWGRGGAAAAFTASRRSSTSRA